MFLPFCGQCVFTGKFSYSIMTPMVQSSRSFSLVSSSVCRSRSAFSVISCKFCAVKLLFSLSFPKITLVTVVKKETTGVLLTHDGQVVEKLAHLRWMLKTMHTVIRAIQKIPNPIATTQSQGCGRALLKN